MRAIDQVLAGTCQWGANPFRLGKDSPWFVGLLEAIHQHCFGIHPTALQGDKMGESASCRAGVVGRALPPYNDPPPMELLSILCSQFVTKGRELRETNVGAAYWSCLFNSFNSSCALPYSNGCWFLPLVQSVPS